MVCKIYAGNKSSHKFKDKKINLKNWHISFAQLLKYWKSKCSFKVVPKWKVYTKNFFSSLLCVHNSIENTPKLIYTGGVCIIHRREEDGDVVCVRNRFVEN